MAELTLKTRLLNKYNQTIADDVKLGAGEINFVEVNIPLNDGSQGKAVLMKVGDGVTAYSNLDYVAAKAADVYAWAKEEGLTVTKDGTGNVVSNITWDATLNDGKGGIKFTTAAVATSEGLEDLQDRVGIIEGDYVTEAELTAAVEALNAAIGKKADKTALEAEVTRAKAAEQANANAIAAIKDGTTVDSFADVEAALNNKVDKVAGKSLVSDTEIERLAKVDNYDDTQIKADIAKNATAASNAQTAAETAQSDVNAIKADYLKTSDKTELSDAITAEANRAKAAEKTNADAIAVINADYLTSEDKTELTGAIGTVEETAEAAKTAIEAFLKDADATADAVDTLKEIQAELDAGEASAASMLAKITALEEVDNATQAELDSAVTALNTAIDKKADATTVNSIAGRVETLETADYATTTQVATAKSEAISTAATDATTKADAALASAKTYADQAEADAVATAAADATAKANKALEDAKAYADANDKDTTYTAAANGGLILTGTEFALDTSITFILDANA